MTIQLWAYKEHLKKIICIQWWAIKNIKMILAPKEFDRSDVRLSLLRTPRFTETRLFDLAMLHSVQTWTTTQYWLKFSAFKQVLKLLTFTTTSLDCWCEGGYSIWASSMEQFAVWYYVYGQSASLSSSSKKLFILSFISRRWSITTFLSWPRSCSYCTWSR